MDSLNRAIVLYLGYETEVYPKCDADRIHSSFEGQEAGNLASQVKALLAELDAVRPDWKAHTLVSGSAWAVAQLKRTHSELDDNATAALEWAYSWWNR
jgi:hypothetical protein